MDFLLLGPVEAHANGQSVPLGRRRERLLLGVLLLDAGKPVSIDRLVDLLWADEPTPAARGSLHSHVARLRSALQGHQIQISTSGASYIATVDPDNVDAYRFRRLVARANAVADPEQRSGLLRRALGLWRGPLLADVAGDELRERIASDLTELRLTATESGAEADLACGRHDQVVVDLTGPVRAHPTRERLAGLLMLALYRSGRQADALAVYGHTRDVLDEELGLTPGAELAALHQRILRNDPDLSPAPPAPPRHRRRFLPRDVPDFTGRVEELAQLDTLAPPDPQTVAVTTIAGPPGVGKTALAVRWAHRAGDRFPDGQLFVDLRGYDERHPLEPLDGLARCCA